MFSFFVCPFLADWVGPTPKMHHDLMNIMKSTQVFSGNGFSDLTKEKWARLKMNDTYELFKWSLEDVDRVVAECKKRRESRHPSVSVTGEKMVWQNGKKGKWRPAMSPLVMIIAGFAEFKIVDRCPVVQYTDEQRADDFLKGLVNIHGTKLARNFVQHVKDARG